MFFTKLFSIIKNFCAKLILSKCNYEDPEFSIVKLPLEQEDITRLKETVHLMQQIKGFTIAAKFFKLKITFFKVGFKNSIKQ